MSVAIVTHEYVRCHIYRMNALLADNRNIITKTNFSKLFKQVYLDADTAISNKTIQWEYVGLSGTQTFNLTNGTEAEMNDEINNMIVLVNRFYYGAEADIVTSDKNTAALLIVISLLTASTNRINARVLTKMSAFETYYGPNILKAQAFASTVKFPASHSMLHEDVLFSTDPFKLISGELSDIGNPEVFVFEQKVKYMNYSAPRQMSAGLYKTSENCSAIFR